MVVFFWLVNSWFWLVDGGINYGQIL